MEPECSIVLREALEIAGNITRLAKETGISRATLINWKAGYHSPRPEKLIRLTKYINQERGFRTDQIMVIQELTIRGASLEEAFNAGQTFARRTA